MTMALAIFMLDTLELVGKRTIQAVILEGRTQTVGQVCRRMYWQARMRQLMMLLLPFLQSVAGLLTRGQSGKRRRSRKKGSIGSLRGQKRNSGLGEEKGKKGKR